MGNDFLNSTKKTQNFFGIERNTKVEGIHLTKYLTRIAYQISRSESLNTVQSNRTIMAVGREMCNLNKSYIVSCIQSNRQKHSSQAFCVRATVEML
jgi:hypothetical protein